MKFFSNLILISFVFLGMMPQEANGQFLSRFRERIRNFFLNREGLIERLIKSQLPPEQLCAELQNGLASNGFTVTCVCDYDASFVAGLAGNIDCVSPEVICVDGDPMGNTCGIYEADFDFEYASNFASLLDLIRGATSGNFEEVLDGLDINNAMVKITNTDGNVLEASLEASFSGGEVELESCVATVDSVACAACSQCTPTGGAANSGLNFDCSALGGEFATDGCEAFL